MRYHPYFHTSPSIEKEKMLSSKLTFPQLECVDFTIKECSDVELEFTEHFLKHQAWSECKVLDEDDSMWKDKVYENIDYIRREDVSSISLAYSNKNDMYEVHACTASSVVVIKIKEKKTAMDLQKKLVLWRFKAILP
jgi:hypothetical protein